MKPVHLPKNIVAKLGRAARRIAPLAGLSVMAAVGCTQSAEAPPPERVKPHALALSTYDAPVGQMVNVWGTNFADGQEGQMQLVFNGTFHADDKTTEEVNNTVDARFIDNGSLAWETFGPYKNPMSAGGDKTGTFEGTVAAQIVKEDGTTVTDDAPLPVTFHVQPSIIVKDLQPVGAKCAGPAIRGLGGFVYRLNVQAIGFTPTVFTYTVSAPSLPGNQSRSVRTVAAKNGATFDNLILPELPENVFAYTALIGVEAVDAQGKSHATAFGLGVHRPMEVQYDGSVTVAETLAPTPVSGCIPGGDNGREVEYNEQTTETRIRKLDERWDTGWVQQRTKSNANTVTNGTTKTNEVNFSTTDGKTFGWSQSTTKGTTNTVGGGVNAGGTLFGLVNVGAEGHYDHATENSSTSEKNGSVSSSTTKGTSNSTAVDHSEATTNTTSDSVSNSKTLSTGAGTEKQSSIAQLRGFKGKIVAERFGIFYRQTTRLIRHAKVIVFNQCGQSQKVADLDMQDWAWSPDLAQGESCLPLPASTLPQASCIVGPCDSQAQ